MSTLQFGDQVFNFGWRYAISSIIFMIFVNHLTCSECKFHSNGSIFHFWEQIFLKWGDWYFFMSNVCYLAVILIFLVVTWWLPVFIARYCWVLLVTARYCSFPLLVWTSFFLWNFWEWYSVEQLWTTVSVAW